MVQDGNLPFECPGLCAGEVQQTAEASTSPPAQMSSHPFKQLWLDALLITMAHPNFPYLEWQEAICCEELLTHALITLMQPGCKPAAQLSAASISFLGHVNLYTFRLTTSRPVLARLIAEGHLAERDAQQPCGKAACIAPLAVCSLEPFVQPCWGLLHV